jgi:hypothetical protein
MLSMLNRIHPLKSQEDVHILDLANQAADIQAAFEPWFETTITEPSDPNLLSDKQREVMDYGLLVASEMQAFIRVLAAAGPGRMPEAAERKLHAELHEYLPVRQSLADPAAGQAVDVGRHRGRGPKPLPAGVHRAARRVPVGCR